MPKLVYTFDYAFTCLSYASHFIYRGFVVAYLPQIVDCLDVGFSCKFLLDLISSKWYSRCFSILFWKRFIFFLIFFIMFLLMILTCDYFNIVGFLFDRIFFLNDYLRASDIPSRILLLHMSHKKLKQFAWFIQSEEFVYTYQFRSYFLEFLEFLWKYQFIIFGSKTAKL